MIDCSNHTGSSAMFHREGMLIRKEWFQKLRRKPWSLRLRSYQNIRYESRFLDMIMFHNSIRTNITTPSPERDVTGQRMLSKSGRSASVSETIRPLLENIFYSTQQNPRKSDCHFLINISIRLAFDWLPGLFFVFCCEFKSSIYLFRSFDAVFLILRRATVILDRS